MNEPQKKIVLTDGVVRGALLAFLAALLVYLPTFLPGSEYGLVNYDDPSLVSPANPAIGQGPVAGLATLLDPTAPRQFMHAWLPLYYWSAGLDHALFGPEALWGWHLHSALLHGLGAALVVVLAWRLRMSALAGAAAGLVFALHPAATESVAWIASRKDQLSFVWMGLSGLAYFVAVQNRRPEFHWWGATCLLVSLMAKGSTLVLPLLLTVHALLLRRDGEGWVRRIVATFPYFAVSAVMVRLHWWVALREGTANVPGNAGLGDLLVANLEVAWRYATTLVLPLAQTVDHGIAPDRLTAWGPVLGGIVAGLTALVGFGNVKSRPAVAAAFLAVPLALAPFNNIFPRTTVLFAERYLYVALLPFSLALGALITMRMRGVRGAFPLIAVVALAGVATSLRLPVWKNSTALWEDAVRRSPESALSHLQLAEAHAESAAMLRTEAAGLPAGPQRSELGSRIDDLDRRTERTWKTALGLARSDVERGRAEAGLGTHLFVTAASVRDPGARLREAVSWLLASEQHITVGLPPEAPREELYAVYANRASARELLGDVELAAEDWRSAVQIDDRSAVAWNGIARSHVRLGRPDEARKALATSRELEKRAPAVVLERVQVHLALGDAGGAKDELEAAIAANPGEALLRLEAGKLERRLGRPVQAVPHLRRAHKMLAHRDDVRDLLAATLLEQAEAQAVRLELEEARKAAEESLTLTPESFAPHQILAIVARQQGDAAEAARHLRRARDLHPEGRRIRRALASLLAERAVEDLDAGREGTALLLLEEAVSVGSDVYMSPALRMEVGVTSWPGPAAPGDDRGIVSRIAALRGLGYLVVGRAEEAWRELSVAAAGARGVDEALLRPVLDLSARAAFLLGKVDDALAVATELHGLGPGRDEGAWEPAARLAVARMEAGMVVRRDDASAAESHFAAALSLLDDSREAGLPQSRHHLRRGEVHFAAQRYIEATKEFDRAVELDPADPDPLIDLAAVWRTKYVLEEDRSFLDGAKQDLERALELGPSDPRALAALGETLLMLERRQEAFPVLMRAVLLDPSQRGARAMLAGLMVHAGRSFLEGENRDLEQAKKVVPRVLALDPPTPDAWIFEAEVLRATGEWRRAEEAHLAVREKFPDRIEPVQALAKFYLDAGLGSLMTPGLQGRVQAVESFHRALALEGPEVDVSQARERLTMQAQANFRDGARLHAEGRLEEAEKHFRLSVRAEETPDGWFALAVVLGEAEDFDGAVAALTRSLELRPGHLPALLSRAVVHKRAGRLDHAETDYVSWLAAAPEDDPERRRVENDLAWVRKLREELGFDDGAPPPESER